MEASKRERIVLFGVVPVFAAVLGAIVTVVVGQLTGGGGNSNDVALEIVKNSALTFEQKRQLMELANANTSKFYVWLSSIGSLLLFAMGLLGPSIAQRIRGD